MFTLVIAPALLNSNMTLNLPPAGTSTTRESGESIVHVRVTTKRSIILFDSWGVVLRQPRHAQTIICHHLSNPYHRQPSFFSDAFIVSSICPDFASSISPRQEILKLVERFEDSKTKPRRLYEQYSLALGTWPVHATP